MSFVLNLHMNRFDRVTAILIQLQSKKVVKAQDIADRFRISLRTVYRDVRTLEEAGVPIIGEAGVGYSIVEGYRLPPVMFTREEAIAFLTAEKIMEKLTDVATITRYKSAMYKIKSVLRLKEKDLLEDLDEQIAVRERSIPTKTFVNDNTLELLLKSISDKQIVRIQYATAHSNTTSERDIEPIGIFHDYGYWHTIAFCYARNDYRHFRTDRILQIALTDRTFNKEHFTLKEYLDRVKDKGKVETIVIRVAKQTAQYLSERKYQHGFVSETEKDDLVEMTFLSTSLEGFARWFLMFADMAEIVQSDALKARIKVLLDKISAKF